MADIVEHLTKQLESVYGRRRWIVAMDVLAATRATVDSLRELGAESALCVAAARGAGPGPDPEFAPEPVVLDVVGEDMMSTVRRSMEQLANLPTEAVGRIERFDPARTARVIGTIFDDGRPVGGRRKYGARPAAWRAIEDKTTIDLLWDAVAVARSPSAIVRLSDVEGLERASHRLDEGAGTVWSADNLEGFHGGASFVRSVRTAEDRAVVRRMFAGHAEFVRVMPYLEGIPCSVHGFVFDDFVAALRPCEMLVFRRPTGAFQYGRAATFWDPPDADRAEMRDLARRTGHYLRREVGYRGAFTMDGIMTVKGFRPTELNPRFGAALGVLAGSIDIPVMLLNLAVVEGEEIDWRPREFEELLLTAADEHRGGGTMAIVPGVEVAAQTASLVFDGDRFREVEGEETPDAMARVGPHPSGSIVFINFLEERTPVGTSVAPRAVAALTWADEQFALGIGPLEFARDVRA